MLNLQRCCGQSADDDATADDQAQLAESNGNNSDSNAHGAPTDLELVTPVPEPPGQLPPLSAGVALSPPSLDQETSFHFEEHSTMEGTRNSSSPYAARRNPSAQSRRSGARSGRGGRLDDKTVNLLDYEESEA